MKYPLEFNIIIVSAGFLITGIFSYLMLKLHKRKHKAETLATITAYKRYIEEIGFRYEYVFHDVTVEFEVDHINYRVKETIARKSRRYSPRKDYLLIINNRLCLKRLHPSCKEGEFKEELLGKEIDIYYNNLTNTNIEIDINNYRGKLSVVSYLFISIGIVGLSIAFYLSKIT